MTYDNADPTAYLRSLWTDEEASSNATIENVQGIYVSSDRDDDLQQRLQRLVLNAARRRDPRLPHSADNRAPGKGLTIVGASGAGKSTLLQETFKSNTHFFPNYADREAWCPLVSIGAPAPCTLLQLATRILERLGYDTARVLKENVAWLRVRDQLQLQKILFLHIDDPQHVLHQLSEEEVQKVRDTLKDLMTSLDWPVQLILSGLPELIPFVRKDRQLRRRLRFMHLDRLSSEIHTEFVAEAVVKYTETAGIKLDIAAEDALANRLMHAGQYEMGITLEILGEAIECALERRGRKLTLEDFADAYAARNLMPDDQNPFLARAWDTIDTSLLQPKEPGKDDEEDDGEFTQTPQAKRQRRRKRK